MSTPYESELCHALDESYANGVQIRSATKIFADAELTTADMSPPAAQIAHSCRATVACQWIDEKTLETCGAEISCNSVSVHFRDTHGIRKMEEFVTIPCMWNGCRKCVKRKGFARHIQEPHLGHPRQKKDDS